MTNLTEFINGMFAGVGFLLLGIGIGYLAAVAKK